MKDVPIHKYDNIYICTPDSQKLKIIKYGIENKKNILVEKPLISKTHKLKKIEKNAKKNNVFIYTAYNHRFEPSLVELKKIISKK